jgi:chromosome segregation ATPase
MSIEIASTTDSKEAVMAAKGDLASKKESEVEQKSVSSQSDEQDETTEKSDISEKESNDESDDYESEDELEDSEEDSEEIKDDEKPKKKKGGFKKRIERFQKQLSVKDQEIEFLKQQMSKGKTSDEAVAEKKPQIDTTSKPTPDNFETHEEYIDALTDWKIESKEKLKEQKAKESEAKSEYQKQIESYQSKVLEVKKTHDDFDDVMEDVDDIKVSATVHQIILDSDFGPSLAYELAKNKSEFERINKLNPLAAAKEIGKIEARLTSKSESKKEIKVTKAPQPLKAVGSGSKGTIQKSPDDMSYEEFKEWRKTHK